MEVSHAMKEKILAFEDQGPFKVAGRGMFQNSFGSLNEFML
jgi:hypothetical protein